MRRSLHNYRPRSQSDGRIRRTSRCDRLELPDAQDQRSGVLVALYRHLGKHIKLGAGYNFTDFSDDLTDLDYDHQGLFINLIGKI